jgi:hypothetical protein
MAPSFVIVDRVGGGGGMWPDGTNPALVLYECIPTITAAVADEAEPSRDQGNL